MQVAERTCKTDLDHRIVISGNFSPHFQQTEVLLYAKVIGIHRTAFPGMQHRGHLCVLPCRFGGAQTGQQVVNELPARIVHNSEPPVDPLLVRIPRLGRHRPRGQDKEIYPRKAGEELRRCFLNVLDQSRIALEELVLDAWHGGLGESRDDGVGGGAIAPYDYDVRVSSGVAREGLGHGLAYPRGAPEEDSDRSAG